MRMPPRFVMHSCILIAAIGLQVLRPEQSVAQEQAVSAAQNQNGDLIVRSHQNGLVINDVVLNRGNCELNLLSTSILPKTLDFGDQFVFGTSCHHILEAELHTNQGTVTLTWD